MIDTKKESWSEKLIPWCIPVLLIIAWQILTSAGIIGENVLPKPTKVLSTFTRLVMSGELGKHIWISAKRAFAGFLVGGGIGLILGLTNGVFPIARKLLDSTIQMVRNIPHLALIPLVILWFGIGEEAKLVLVALGVFFPLYINSYHGIRSIEPGLVEMGRVYNMKGLSLFRDIVLPGALPSILVGVRYSLGIMWLTLIVAETVAADSGIGYMAMNAREFMQMDVIVLSILIYAILGKLSDSVAKVLEKRLLQWNPNYSKN